MVHSFSNFSPTGLQWPYLPLSWRPPEPSSRPPATQTPSAKSGLRSTFQTQAPRSGHEAKFPTNLEESYALESRPRIFQGKANAAARLLAVGGARAAVCSFVQATTDFPKEIFPFPTFAIFLPPCWAWPESVRLLPDRHSRTFAEIPQLNFVPVPFPLFVKTILENLAPSPANPHLMLVRVTFLHVCGPKDLGRRNGWVDTSVLPHRHMAFE